MNIRGNSLPINYIFYNVREPLKAENTLSLDLIVSIIFFCATHPINLVIYVTSISENFTFP